jgi:hypothetical protein
VKVLLLELRDATPRHDSKLAPHQGFLALWHRLTEIKDDSLYSNMSVSPVSVSPASAMTAFLGGALFTIWAAIPWVMVFLVTQLVGIRLYVIKDKDVALRIQKRLTNSSHVADGGKGYGYSVGRWYFASVSINRGEYSVDYDVWMIATAASFEALTRENVVPRVSTEGVSTEEEEDEGAEAKAMTVFERVGTFTHVWFKKRSITLPEVVPRPDQEVVLEAICEHQKKRRHTVVFLHGPPGSGKSMIGVMLARRLGAGYCNTLKPWQPGDTLADLYAEAEPSAEKPLVVAFDEFDGPLTAIHVGIAPHKAVPISVGNKAGWNKLLDEIDRGMFPFLVLVLTSNRDPAFIRALDPSYIREGRVDLTIPVHRV